MIEGVSEPEMGELEVRIAHEGFLERSDRLVEFTGVISDQAEIVSIRRVARIHVDRHLQVRAMGILVGKAQQLGRHTRHASWARNLAGRSASQVLVLRAGPTGRAASEKAVLAEEEPPRRGHEDHEDEENQRVDTSAHGEAFYAGYGSETSCWPSSSPFSSSSRMRAAVSAGPRPAPVFVS